MKKFDVEITETLQRKVSVEAASQEDAERMVTQAWNNQDYVLDSGDFTGVDSGDFLVVGLTEDDFGSLTSEQMQKFEEQFHQPQMFVRMGRSIMAIPVPDDMVKKMEEKAAKPQEKSKPAPDRDSL